jgi:hypothetical protein
MTTPTEDLRDEESFPDGMVLLCTRCGGGLAYIVAHLLRTESLQHMLTTLVEKTGLTCEVGPMDRLWEIDLCTCNEDSPHA